MLCTFVPGSDSDLVDGGTAQPRRTPGYAFVSPLLLAMHPPPGDALTYGSAGQRPSDGSPDIGAYETGSDSGSGSDDASGASGAGGGCFTGQPR